MSMLRGKVILVTGGTGSFGTAFIRTVLEDHDPASVRVFSRDELKQSEMAQNIVDPRIRFFLGDVRSAERLDLACRGVDVIVHAAALKQVPACEYNPFEAVQTNVIGAENVVSAATANKVERILALSTDKAVNPVNLYGATKLCAEKIFTQANSYTGTTQTSFSSVRYGNVVGSRGSIVPLIREQARRGELTITDESMTRFWISLEQAVAFVLHSLEQMEGGEVFIPKVPSMRLGDLVDALAPDVPRRIIGLRPGEKMHEVLITEDESRHAMEFPQHYSVYPAFPFWRETPYPAGQQLEPGFHYSSDSNTEWLTLQDFRELVPADSAASVSGR